jgi:hypothetical protein
MRRLFVAIMLSALLNAPALACGVSSNSQHISPTWPPATATIDRLLPNAKLTDAEVKNIKALRAEITKLVDSHKLNEARAVEVKAMEILGYKWTSFICTPPMWVKSSPKTVEAVGHLGLA